MLSGFHACVFALSSAQFLDEHFAVNSCDVAVVFSPVW